MTTLEPDTCLQPSLHALTADDWYDLVLGECERRGVDVADLRKEMESLDEDHVDTGVIFDEIQMKAEERLSAAGYCVWTDFDLWAIYPKGYQPSEQELMP